MVISSHTEFSNLIEANGRNIYTIIKTMCPPDYHHNGFVATHALGHMMYGYKLINCINWSETANDKT